MGVSYVVYYILFHTVLIPSYILSRRYPWRQFQICSLFTCRKPRVAANGNVVGGNELPDIINTTRNEEKVDVEDVLIEFDDDMNSRNLNISCNPEHGSQASETAHDKVSETVYGERFRARVDHSKQVRDPFQNMRLKL